MGRAEVGSTKWVSNQAKSKGLGRLRWYCQVCERQMRDENGFKMHVQSESHVRQMLVVGEDPRKAIAEYSRQFSDEFLRQLRTSHGTKAVHMNHFYQEYIANKEHVHMNSTRWGSLTEYAKYLGQEGLCRVEETDKGLHIAWVDTSPEALKRAEAVRRKEMLDKGDEERELRLIREQQKRAEKAAEERRREKGLPEDEGKGDEGEKKPDLQIKEGEKIKLTFGPPAKQGKKDGEDPGQAENKKKDGESPAPTTKEGEAGAEVEPAPKAEPAKPAGFSFGAKPPQAKNVFAQAKKNALAGGTKKAVKIEQPKKMSEAERIMREEMDKKRARGPFGGGGSNKKPRLG